MPSDPRVASESSSFLSCTMLGDRAILGSPAFQLMGVNMTETRANLNVSMELLSMGIVPGGMKKSPTLLPSLKDFDDTDKRLDAAYRRQARFGDSRRGLFLAVRRV